MHKKALILGIGGQDGYYLTDLLYSKGYQVWGVLLPQDLSDVTLSGLKGKATLLQGDIRDGVIDSPRTIVTKNSPRDMEAREGKIRDTGGISDL